MPSLVLIGPAVRPAIGNIHTDKQTNKQTDTHIAFYYVDSVWTMLGMRRSYRRHNHPRQISSRLVKRFGGYRCPKSGTFEIWVSLFVLKCFSLFFLLMFYAYSCDTY